MSGCAEADEAQLVDLMPPGIKALQQREVTALVQGSTTGVGSRADFDVHVYAPVAVDSLGDAEIRRN